MLQLCQGCKPLLDRHGSSEHKLFRCRIPLPNLGICWENRVATHYVAAIEQDDRVRGAFTPLNELRGEFRAIVENDPHEISVQAVDFHAPAAVTTYPNGGQEIP